MSRPEENRYAVWWCKDLDWVVEVIRDELPNYVSPKHKTLEDAVQWKSILKSLSSVFSKTPRGI